MASEPLRPGPARNSPADCSAVASTVAGAPAFDDASRTERSLSPPDRTHSGERNRDDALAGFDALAERNALSEVDGIDARTGVDGRESGSRLAPIRRPARVCRLLSALSKEQSSISATSAS